MKIKFYNQGFQKVPIDKKITKKLIRSIISLEDKKLGAISYIFTTNNYLLEINKSFLKHSYYTDVITFSEGQKESIEGEVYISSDQVILNSKKYGTNLNEEFMRIIIHGTLHLIGYSDNTAEAKAAMTGMEEKYLVLYNKIS